MFFLASTKACDFENCHSHTTEKLDYCSYPYHLCDNNTNCIEADMLCNDKRDCIDGSDEGGQCGKLKIFIIYRFNINNRPIIIFKIRFNKILILNLFMCMIFVFMYLCI